MGIAQTPRYPPTHNPIYTYHAGNLNIIHAYSMARGLHYEAPEVLFGIAVNNNTKKQTFEETNIQRNANLPGFKSLFLCI